MSLIKTTAVSLTEGFYMLPAQGRCTDYHCITVETRAGLSENNLHHNLHKWFLILVSNNIM